MIVVRDDDVQPAPQARARDPRRRALGRARLRDAGRALGLRARSVRPAVRRRGGSGDERRRRSPRRRSRPRVGDPEPRARRAPRRARPHPVRRHRHLHRDAARRPACCPALVRSRVVVTRNRTHGEMVTARWSEEERVAAVVGGELEARGSPTMRPRRALSSLTIASGTPRRGPVARARAAATSSCAMPRRRTAESTANR